MADISAVLSALVNQSVVVVDVTTDANGWLTQVVVVVPGGDAAVQVVIDLIRDLSTQSGECTAGVLCHATDVFIVVSSERSPSAANTRLSTMSLPLLSLFVSLQLLHITATPP